jgi:hypothetical protein
MYPPTPVRAGALWACKSSLIAKPKTGECKTIAPTVEKHQEIGPAAWCSFGRTQAAPQKLARANELIKGGTRDAQYTPDRRGFGLRRTFIAAVDARIGVGAGLQ